MTQRTVMTWICTCASLLLMAAATQAQANPICGPEIKAQIAKQLDELGVGDDPYSEATLAAQAPLYEAYKYCAADGANTPLDDSPDAVCGKLAYAGSNFYERMRCCGYDPQHQFFACPIEILQPFGFGAAPLPGSFEHVLTCVDFGNGWTVAARDNVHLADAVSGSPVWNFQVFARARRRLAETALQGQTLRARSILSFGFAPTGCNFQPVFGNVIDYKIRLDR